MINFISYDQLYFKSANGSMIDIFLSTKKHLFQKANSFETSITDHHHLIATVIQKTYEISPPKFLVCRSGEYSWNDSLKNKCKSINRLTQLTPKI